MIAGKHFDPILGLDIHIVLIPSPAGPVPTPLPHPYVGFMLDPFDYLPLIGATVLVNGLPRAQAGSAGMGLPKHIPMGGPFQKPPTFESEMFMGSSSVLIDGEPFSYTALPVLSCQDIGMPAPLRLKKKSAAKSLMLPSTMLLAIPMGAPVLVGGAPTISMSALAMRAGLSALGKGLKKVRKLQKGSRRMKALSDALHAKANKLCDKLGLGDVARARVHKGVCTVTGHPVDVATGKVFTDRVDFELPGPIPFRLERTWYSTSTYRGPLGDGWHHSYDLALHLSDDILLLRTADGRHVGFPRLSPGESYFEPRERLTLHCQGLGQYRLQATDGLSYGFDTLPARSGRSAEQLGLSDELRLVFVRDRSGNQIELERDGQGQLLRIVDSAGRVLTAEHDAEGRMLALRAPHPDRADETVRVLEYRYDRHGDLIECRDALGRAQRFAYKNHLLVKETDRTGLSFHFSYDGQDASAKCVRTWGDGGIYDHKLSYDPITQITTVENSLGHKTLYQHDDGVVVRTVDPLGGTALVSYGEHGRKLSATDPNGLTTRYQYDARGNMTQVTTPDGAKLTVNYAEDDLPAQVTDALGGVWSFQYDAAGRLTERMDPLGQSVRMWYTGDGLLAGVTDAEDHATALSHDQAGNVETYTTPNGAVTRLRYDGWGRVVEVIDARGNAQQRWFDLLGQLERVHETDGNVRTLRHDPEGRVIHVKDAQHDIELGYQGTGRLAYRSEAKTTVRFRYDSEERLIGVENEQGLVYGFELDPCGKVVVERGFDDVRRVYRRDLGGRVRELERSSGRRSKYTYDAASRITAIEYSDGAKERYKYRLDGEVIEAANAEGSVRFERDALGRVLKETWGAHWVASSYAPSGQRSELRSSLGAAQRVARNAMGDVLSVEEGSRFAARFERDVMGLELERSLPGGVLARWKRDALGRPLEHELSSGGGVLRGRSYDHGFDDRLRMTIDAMRGPIQYAHDTLGKLASARHADGTLELRLPDAVGNLFKREDRGDRKYGAAGQLIETQGPSGATHYRYDADGNLTEKVEPEGRIWSYRWNAAGMLAAVTRPDGAEIDFAYDAVGRRIRKTFGNRTTHWVWDGHVPLHEWMELDAPEAAREEQEPLLDARALAVPTHGAPLTSPLAEAAPSPGSEEGTRDAPITWLFEPGSFTPLAKLVGEQSYPIVPDQLGTPVSMLDATGAEIWSAELDVYGELRELRGARGACPFRWPGQYEDRETGLYYNRLRYYDPAAGTYVSQDPIGLLGSLRMYGYVDDPTLQVDPFGLTAVQLAAAMAADGRPLSSGQTAHHIVKENASGYADHSRNLLARNEIDVNDSPNGARLWGTHPNQVSQPNHPGRTAARAAGNYHGGTHIHGPANDRLIYRILRGAERSGADLEGVLREIGRRMESGSWQRTAQGGCYG